MEGVLFSGVWRCRTARYLEPQWFVNGHGEGRGVGIFHSVTMDDHGFGVRFAI